jgi:hypothetical protein
MDIEDVQKIKGSPEYYGSGVGQKMNLEEFIDIIGSSDLNPVYESTFVSTGKFYDPTYENATANKRGSVSEDNIASFPATAYTDKQLKSEVFCSLTVNKFTRADAINKVDVIFFKNNEDKLSNTDALNLIKDIDELFNMLGASAGTTIHVGNKVWFNNSFDTLNQENPKDREQLKKFGLLDNSLDHNHVLDNFEEYKSSIDKVKLQYNEILKKIYALPKPQQKELSVFFNMLEKKQETTLVSGQNQVQTRQSIFKSMILNIGDLELRTLLEEYYKIYIGFSIIRKRISRQAQKEYLDKKLNFEIIGVQVKTGDNKYYDYIKGRKGHENNGVGVLRQINPSENDPTFKMLANDCYDDEGVRSGMEIDDIYNLFDNYNKVFKKVLDIK